MKTGKREYRFYDPNAEGISADALLRLLIEINRGKAERALQALLEKDAGQKQRNEVCPNG